jgi:pyruvate/2-oxoglutarate dehydrogenase complex dihydrolipoamide acyltransferase (E2) component
VARRDPFESLPARKKRDLPFPFVLDELAPLDPVTRPMFGALGVYVGDRIVMILRDKGPDDPDSGVWLAYEPAHEAAVVALLPRLSPIELFRHKVAGWQKLASRSLNFEEDVGTLCALVLEGDERIGKVPGTKRRRAAATQSPAAAKPAAPAAAKKAMPSAAKKASPAAAKKAPPAAAKKAAGRVAPSSKQSTKRAAKKPPRLSHGW